MLSAKGGEADGCAGCNEALLRMEDVQGLSNGARRTERNGAGRPAHLTFVEGLKLMFAPASMRVWKALATVFVGCDQFCTISAGDGVLQTRWLGMHKQAGARAVNHQRLTQQAPAHQRRPLHEPQTAIPQLGC